MTLGSIKEYASYNVTRCENPQKIIRRDIGLELPKENDALEKAQNILLDKVKNDNELSDLYYLMINAPKQCARSLYPDQYRVESPKNFYPEDPFDNIRIAASTRELRLNPVLIQISGDHDVPEE